MVGQRKRIVFITLAVATYNCKFFNLLHEKLRHEADLFIIYYGEYGQHVPANISKDTHLIPVRSINILNTKLMQRMINSHDSIIHYFHYYPDLRTTLDRIHPDIIHTFLYFMPYSLQASRY